jgi:Zn-dependent protease with chaperone function
MDPAREQQAERAQKGWSDPYNSMLLVLLLLLFVGFFGLLIGVYFFLFDLIDVLLDQQWQWGTQLIGRALAVFILAVLAFRLARWLALCILGLVTERYDSPELERFTIGLDRDTYSALHEVVADVCRLTNAPEPDAIRLGADAECYVIEERRFALRTKHRFTLVLGLPQLLVLSLSELRVILTHEMAHLGADTRLSVFAYRFTESLRIALDQLRARWWSRFDPLYWFFAGFSQIVIRVAAPAQRRRELRADAISAEAYGGTLASHTLLKEWLIENQFEQVLEELSAAADTDQPLPRDGTNISPPNVYRVFVDRWRDFSRDGEAYLAQRLDQVEDWNMFDSHPTMRSRIKLMRDYPEVAIDSDRPAGQLLPDIESLEQRLCQM